jgi:hypothetical protein
MYSEKKRLKGDQVRLLRTRKRLDSEKKGWIDSR